LAADARSSLGTHNPQGSRGNPSELHRGFELAPAPECGTQKPALRDLNQSGRHPRDPFQRGRDAGHFYLVYDLTTNVRMRDRNPQKRGSEAPISFKQWSPGIPAPRRKAGGQGRHPLTRVRRVNGISGERRTPMPLQHLPTNTDLGPRVSPCPRLVYAWAGFDLCTRPSVRGEANYHSTW